MTQATADDARDPSLASVAPSALLRQFNEVQEQRVELYHTLDAAFKRVLTDGAEQQYKELLAALGPAFNELSLRVIAIEREFKAREGTAHIALMLRAVQEAERTKLRMTLTLQALKKPFHERVFSWQNEPADGEGCVGAPEPTHEHEHGAQGHVCTATAESRAALVAAAAQHMAGADTQGEAHAHAVAADSAAGAAAHEHDEGCGSVPPEATREEYEAAVTEATKELSDSVEAINTALEELRYEAADFAAEED